MKRPPAYQEKAGEATPSAPMLGTPLVPQILHGGATAKEVHDNEKEILNKTKDERIHRLGQLNLNAEALTVPVTIGPVIPLFCEQKIVSKSQTMTVTVMSPKRQIVVSEDQFSESESVVSLIDLPNVEPAQK